MIPGREGPAGGGGPSAALALVLGDPLLWLLGAAGFLVRGGFVVLALPIWTLPTAVEISTLVGPDAFGAGGLAPRGVALALGAGGVALLLLFGALIASAAVDVAAWDRLAADPDRDTAARPSGRAARGRDLARVVDVAGVALVTVLPALGAFVVVAVAVGYAIWAEIVMPGPLDVPLGMRVAARAAPALAALGVALVVGELLHGLASRRVLVAAGEPAARHWPVLRSLAYAVRHPLRPLATAGAGWLVTAAALVPGLVSISVCWSFVRTTYRESGALGLDDVPALLAATALLVAVWLAALLLAGFASALRSAAWSMLRGGVRAAPVDARAESGPLPAQRSAP